MKCVLTRLSRRLFHTDYRPPVVVTVHVQSICALHAAGATDSGDTAGASSDEQKPLQQQRRGLFLVLSASTQRQIHIHVCHITTKMHVSRGTAGAGIRPPPVGLHGWILVDLLGYRFGCQLAYPMHATGAS